MTETTESDIRVERRGSVGVITIDNRARRNAMNRRMRMQFRDVLADMLSPDDPSRALVITGAGSHFSAGADITEMGKRTMTMSREIMTETGESVRSIVGGQKPVIAAVEGIAFGLGFSYSCAADYVVASSEARFCGAFIRIGLVPDTGIFWSLPQKVGMAKARELLALATELTAEKAAELGIVDQVVAPGTALDEAVAMARQFESMPAGPLAFIKAAMTHGNLSMDAALNTEADYQAILLSSLEHQQTIRALQQQAAASAN